MLPKKNRLTSKYEFNKVRYLANKHNTKYSGKYFHIFWTAVPEYTGPTRFGVVVTTKFDKSAARRNKVKRVFRELFREYSGRIRDDYWVVVHPKFSCSNKTYEEISIDFNSVLQKIPLARESGHHGLPV